jgi:hypothetical protein
MRYYLLIFFNRDNILLQSNGVNSVVDQINKILYINLQRRHQYSLYLFTFEDTFSFIAIPLIDCQAA